MTAITDLDILDRLRNIMRAYTGYSSANDLSEGDDLTVLPSFIVAPLDNAWEDVGNGRRFLVTQGFEIIGLVSVVVNIDPLANRLAAYRVAMPIARPWVAWLHAHPLLGLNDGGLVQSVGAITAGDFRTYAYNNVDYSSFRLQLSATTYNS
jgi:hypothetical protein